MSVQSNLTNCEELILYHGSEYGFCVKFRYFLTLLRLRRQRSHGECNRSEEDFQSSMMAPDPTSEFF